MSKIFKACACIAIIQILPIIFSSCATNNRKTELYYSIPTVSYLRECPAYYCPIVTEIYNADKIKVLDRNESGWWYVQSLRDQKIGWIQPTLLTENPIIPKKYYIAVDQLPLRDSPSEDIISRKLLNYGDEVQKLLEQGDWWRVIAEKDKAIGWVPARDLRSEISPEHLEKSSSIGQTASTPSQPSKTSFYYVVSENTKLYLIPSNSSQVVKVLKLNDKVEKISESGNNWLKVRYVDTGAEGWASARSFKDSPVISKNEILTNKKLIKKAPSSGQQDKKPGNSKSIEPEAM